VKALGPEGEVVFATSGAALPATNLAVTGDGKSSPLNQWTSSGRQFRGVTAAIPTQIPAYPPVTIGLAIDIGNHEVFVSRFEGTLAFYTIGAAIVSGLLGWFAVRRGLIPLRLLSERAAAVTVSELHERIPVESVPIELADLAVTLNEMLDRLELAFQRLLAFSSDIAHELRTPISNLMTETHVALSQARDDDTYRNILVSNAEEFDRLSRMISDMLLLAKADDGLMLPSRECVVLENEVRDLFDFYDALAEERRIELRAVGSGEVQGDRLMLRRALSNLLSNAMRYTPAGGYIGVYIHSDSRAIRIVVENPGEAIEAAQLPHLFDRFFRADKARVHGNLDGTGLGLAITKAIVTAHEGQVSVSSCRGITRFTLTFPNSP
jgi:two-component system heavy metal sensor histidine kinase CusS